MSDGDSPCRCQHCGSNLDDGHGFHGTTKSAALGRVVCVEAWPDGDRWMAEVLGESPRVAVYGACEVTATLNAIRWAEARASTVAVDT